MVTVQLPAEIVALLDAEGKPDGLRRAAVVRRAILRHVRAGAAAVIGPESVNQESITPRPAA